MNRLSNNEYLAKTIEWLKDPERKHNQKEDDKVILGLHSKVDNLIAEGIQLPPPYIRESFYTQVDKYTIQYDYNDFINYIKKYYTNYHREATQYEKKEILYDVIGSTGSYNIYKNEEMLTLIEYGLIPQLELNNIEFQHKILTRLERFKKENIAKLLNYWFTHQDLSDSEFNQLLDILKNKISSLKFHKEKEIQSQKHRNILTHGLQYVRTHNYNYPSRNSNISINTYMYIISLVETAKARKQAKALYDVLESAGPESQLSRLPANLFPNIIEYTTGVKRENYMGGKSRRLKRNRRRLTRKVRN